MPPLPDLPPFTEAVARRWARAAVPVWVPKGFLTVTWLAAAVVATVTDTAHCVPEDPSVCGPDMAFALWFPVALATPVLLLWMPLAGCAAGVAFALANLRFDPVPLARTTFAAHGALCAAVAVWLVWAARRQQRIVRTATGGATATAPPGPPPGPGDPWPARVAAAVLVLAAVGMLRWYDFGVRREAEHLARAVRVESRVVDVDHDDFLLTLKTADGRLRYVEVLDTGQYEPGQPAPLLLDPEDERWARLVGEPRDTTYWVSGAVGAALLAVLLLARQLAGQRARHRLRTGAHPAVAVGAGPHWTADLAIRPADAGSYVVVGEFRPRDRPGGDYADYEDYDEADDDDYVATFGPAWRGERRADADLDADPPEPAVLLGSLRDRGWALLVTADGTHYPAAPLRVRLDEERTGPGLLDRLPWRTRDPQPIPAEPEDEFPGQPVTAASLWEEPALPVEARNARHRRLLGMVGVPVTYVVAPAAVALLGPQPAAAAVAYGGYHTLLRFLGYVRNRVRVTADSLEVVTNVARVDVPWERVVGARTEGERLHVAWEPDELAAGLGPFEAAGGRRGRADRAEQLGALIDLLRQRAAAAGGTGRAARRTPARPWIAIVAYAAVTVGAFVARQVA